MITAEAVFKAADQAGHTPTHASLGDDGTTYPYLTSNGRGHTLHAGAPLYDSTTIARVSDLLKERGFDMISASNLTHEVHFMFPPKSQA